MSRLEEELRDQGRGIVGALLLGVPLLYTMETWWLGWQLPLPVLLSFTVGGLVVVSGLAWLAGFRDGDSDGPADLADWAQQTAELVLQSTVAGLVVLFLLGLIEWGDPLASTARLVLIEVVPLSLGAAVANSILRNSKEPGPGDQPFPKDLGLFALGALFFCLPIAPTEEVVNLASQIGWPRMPFIVTASLLVTYLALYELEFRGHAGRTQGRSTVEHLGECFMVYVAGLSVAVFLLAGLGQFVGQPPMVWVQEAVVLGLPASIGGAAARVVL